MQGNRVTAGLAALFESFSDVMSARDGGEPGVERSRSVLAPTDLREALAALNTHKFGIGAPPGSGRQGLIMCLTWLHVSQQSMRPAPWDLPNLAACVLVGRMAPTA